MKYRGVGDALNMSDNIQGLAPGNIWEFTSECTDNLLSIKNQIYFCVLCMLEMYKYKLWEYSFVSLFGVLCHEAGLVPEKKYGTVHLFRIPTWHISNHLHQGQRISKFVTFLHVIAMDEWILPLNYSKSLSNYSRHDVEFIVDIV